MVVNPLYVPLAVFQAAFSVVSIIVTILAIMRHRLKRTELTGILIRLFIAVTLAIICLTIGSLLILGGVDLANYPSMRPSENPAWLPAFAINFIAAYQLAYIFVVLATFYLYKFSKVVFLAKELKFSINLLVILCTTVLLVFGVVREPLRPLNLDEVGNILYTFDVWILLYVIVVVVPIFIGCIKLLRKIPHTDEHFTNVLSLTVMALGYVVMMLFFVIETVWNVVSGEYPNIFTFIGWGVASLTVVMAYKGFFAKKTAPM